MKFPFIQFFTGDWLKDPKITLCTPATRGIWIDLICVMHECDRSGILRGTRDQLARFARCSTVELTHALTDLQATGAADVTERNEFVTLVCRRMNREYKMREANRLRVTNHRKKRDGNGGETIYDYDSGSEIGKEEGNGEKPNLRVQAEQIYNLYPVKVGKPKALSSIIKAIQKFGFEDVSSKTKDYIKVRNGDFVSIPPTPHPATFYNQCRFNDDPDTWKPYENNASSNKKGFDRNKGTYNEGKAHLYKVKPAPAIPVSDPQRSAIADNAGSG